MIHRRLVLHAGLAAAVLGVLRPSLASSPYPTRPVRIVIPFPPGGSTDIGARLVAANLASDLKQTVYVENRPGAGTTIASSFVASAPPDGLTLYYTGSGTHVVAQALYKKLTYDALKSFQPVGMVNTSPFVVVVGGTSRYATLPALLDALRASQGKLTFGSTGNGALPHLATEMIMRAAGVSAVHVPYQGAGPAMTALMGGQVDFMVSDVAVLPFVTSGKLKALAVTTKEPSDYFPGVATLASAGLDQLSIPSGQAMLAPAGTPPEIVAKLNASLNGALATAEVQQRFATMALKAAPGSPADLERFLQAESTRYSGIVQQLGISLE